MRRAMSSAIHITTACRAVYSPQGELLKTIGDGPGTGPGQLAYVSDALCDDAGNFYVAEFGDSQRISKFGLDGKFVKSWGSPGGQLGQFARIRAMCLGPDRNLYVADSCNHRIQVFTTDGEFVASARRAASQVNSRIPTTWRFRRRGERRTFTWSSWKIAACKKFTLEGQPLGIWGSPGPGAGAIVQSVALAVDSHGAVHVVDSLNDRIQRISF